MLKITDLITVQLFDYPDHNKDAREAFQQEAMEAVNKLKIEEDSPLARALQKAHKRNIVLIVDGYRVRKLSILGSHNNEDVEIGGMFPCNENWRDKLMELVRQPKTS